MAEIVGLANRWKEAYTKRIKQTPEEKQAVLAAIAEFPLPDPNVFVPPPNAQDEDKPTEEELSQINEASIRSMASSTRLFALAVRKILEVLHGMADKAYPDPAVATERKLMLQRLSAFLGMSLEAFVIEVRMTVWDGTKAAFVNPHAGTDYLAAVGRGALREMVSDVIPYNDEDLKAIVGRFYALATDMQIHIDIDVSENETFVKEGKKNIVDSLVREEMIAIAEPYLMDCGAAIKKRKV
ncbi:50S ribosomal L11 methyltransferase, putative [Babesia ovata]|uniref:50S ribosomal L11 methyltransferase, putative n=1 Tax=Babesia ovata TaxID=189622 RepID=A0A2H6KGW9_9APIC|nr:50S ribosomal L11 methyltransferase, putative [Babesia ovata]GBE62250.1 50S ribosomal L11 methyltransferase, putative [Babesia ovata]